MRKLMRKVPFPSQFPRALMSKRGPPSKRPSPSKNRSPTSPNRSLRPPFLPERHDPLSSRPEVWRCCSWVPCRQQLRGPRCVVCVWPAGERWTRSARRGVPGPARRQRHARSRTSKPHCDAGMSLPVASLTPPLRAEQSRAERCTASAMRCRAEQCSALQCSAVQSK